MHIQVREYSLFRERPISLYSDRIAYKSNGTVIVTTYSYPNRAF